MKTFKVILILLAIIFGTYIPIIHAGLVFPEECYTVGEEYTNPGNKTYTFLVEDINGNYFGNFLRVRLKWNAPEGISVTLLHGLSIWENDPNYFVVDDAIHDPNNGDSNLYGSFAITKTWKHMDYKINVQVFDSADNNSCGTGYIYSRDRGKPKVTKFERYQK